MNNQRKAIFTLVDIARKVIAGEIAPIDGSRRIARMRFEVEGEENKVFDSFIGIDAQSGDLVVGNRALWAEAFLTDIDVRYAACEAALRPGIAADCEALLAVFEPKLRECPACGFSPLDAMPYDAAGEPSYEECPCCDFQPGVTDEIGYDSTEWRRRRTAQGMPVHRPPVPAGSGVDGEAHDSGAA